MNCVLNFCLVVTFCILPVSGLSLYSPNDGLVLFENDTILPTLYDSPVIWFVEFYSSWCGHCQTFAPSWKRLAKEVEGWAQVARIAAIDCAEERNHKTCMHFIIEGYPSLKFFSAHSTNTSDVGKLYLGRRSPRKMRHAIIDFLESSVTHSSEQIDFKPLSTKLSDQFYIKKYKGKHLALVFENMTSYLGKELSFDLMNTVKVAVKRVVDDEKRNKKYNVTRLPQVIMLSHNKQYHLAKRTRQDILTELRGYHVKQKKVPTPKVIKATNWHYINVHKNDTRTVSKADLATVHMQDLEGALSSIFRHELVIKETYNLVRKTALKGFVDLLVQCFPGTPPINNFLRSIQTWLGEGNKSEITPAKLGEFVKNSSNLPAEAKWQSCRYSEYPCGLWLLFHTLTVNCAYREPTELTGAGTLMRIRDFIINFFGCIECGIHFHAMSKSVENEVHSFDEGILWLWVAHNRVNKRLSKQHSIYPKHPKIQYPPKFLCTECSVTEKEIHWKKEVVLQFLKVHYGINNIRLAKEVNEVASDEKDVSESVSFYLKNRQVVKVIGLTMTGFDTSLCLIVYGAGIVILILLYIYILRKRSRHAKHFSLMA